MLEFGILRCLGVADYKVCLFAFFKVGRDMYGMNGYMPNGYPMMADPNAYGHHAMTGQMGGLASQYGYNLPPSAAAQMSGQMTTPSYMNGSSSYSYSMAPYMQVSY